MTATARLAPSLTFPAPLPGGPCSPDPVLLLSGRVLGREVTVAADGPVDADALRHLLEQLGDQWDVGRRRSDLARIINRPNVMVAVSRVTLLLVRNTLTAMELAAPIGVDPGLRPGWLDARHGRVGLDPTAVGVAVRLAPAVMVDVLADFCVSSGSTAGYVRVGEDVRDLTASTPAWLRRAAGDSGRNVAPGA